MLEHGGRLRRAALQYDIPVEQWLDLSTGLNPVGWPIIPPSAASWSRLPEDEDGLIQAAQRYYGATHVLPVAGSQAAIQALPRLRAPCRVGLLAASYAEHAYQWRAAGHDVTLLTPSQCDTALAQLDVMVLVNPNNPTGHVFDRQQLLKWHAQLGSRGGWLIVDEAFIDTCPEHSLSTVSDRDGLIVLRSLGKFFGLAGARVGFVLAASSLLTSLAEWLGPWCIAGPSREVATHALNDHTWHVTTRQRLQMDGIKLATLLTQYGLPPTGGTALFQWVINPDAATIHQSLAHDGILTRLFDSPRGLRFGLPATSTEWQRLEQSLQSLRLLNRSTGSDSGSKS